MSILWSFSEPLSPRLCWLLVGWGRAYRSVIHTPQDSSPHRVSLGLGSAALVVFVSWSLLYWKVADSVLFRSKGQSPGSLGLGRPGNEPAPTSAPAPWPLSLSPQPCTCTSAKQTEKPSHGPASGRFHHNLHHTFLWLEWQFSNPPFAVTYWVSGKVLFKDENTASPNVWKVLFRISQNHLTINLHQE